MNIKAITRAMELSDDDWELVTKLRALSETERELLMTALGPQKPAAKKSSKKAGKKQPGILPCVVCGYSSSSIVHTDNTLSDYHPFQSPSKKSQRAQSLGEQLKQRPRGVVTGDDDVENLRCAYEYPKHSPVNAGQVCGERAINGVHDATMGYAGYHPFTFDARSAPPPSDQASSEIGEADVSSAAQGASGGD